MSDGAEKNDEVVRTDKEEIYSKSVRAGKRTYFFDVKTTRRNDYYLTLTESKKRFNRDGRFYFEKHKIFLYKEDFEKFQDGLSEVIEYIKANAPEMLDPLPGETVKPETVAEEKSQETKNQAEEVVESAAAEADEKEVTAVDESVEEPAEKTTEPEVASDTGQEDTESAIKDFSNVEFEDLDDPKES
jgi:hypothetical protein